MEKLLLSAVLSVSTILSYGQTETVLQSLNHKRNFKGCDTHVEQADSSINFKYEERSGSYTPLTVLINKYDIRGNLVNVVKKNLPSRENVYNQIFLYNSDDNLIRYTLQLWDGVKWVDNLINERTYTPDGYIDSEVFLRENSQGLFAPYQRHFYVNENGHPVTYLRQIKDANDNWYNFSEHFYVYDEMGRLTMLYGKYYNRDLVYWERTSFYNSENQITERYFRQLKYDPLIRENVLMNIQQQKYKYNQYGNIEEVYNHDWIENSWVYTNKDVAYYSLLKGKKVSICHKGKEICVAVEAVKAHLAHGDKLGPCPTPDSNMDFSTTNNPRPNQILPGFSLYPNPVKNNVRITLNSDHANYSNCLILSQTGQLIKSFSMKGMCELEIDVSRLRPGLYFIKVTGPYGEYSETIIKE